MQLVLCASETWYLQMLPWMNYNDSLDGVLLEDASWAHAYVWMKIVVTRPVPIACQTCLPLVCVQKGLLNIPGS